MNMGRCLPHMWGFRWGDIQKLSETSAAHTLRGFARNGAGSGCVACKSKIFGKLVVSAHAPARFALKC